MATVTAHACTDVTGFGLVGHARNIALASGVTLAFTVPDLPLAEGALELAREGVVSGGSNRSRAAIGSEVLVDEACEAARVAITFDAETSGGLLIAVAPEDAPQLERAMQERGVLAHRVGAVVERGAHAIELREGGIA